MTYIGLQLAVTLVEWEPTYVLDDDCQGNKYDTSNALNANTTSFM